MTKFSQKLVIIVSAVFVLNGAHCPKVPPAPKGKFESFGASPARVCTNLGNPIVFVSWRVKGSGDTCVGAFRVNGVDLASRLPAGAIGQKCGEGNWNDEFRFSLNDVFGNNIPSTVAVSANLIATRNTPAGPTNDVLDSSSASITVQECSPPGLNTP